MQYSYEFSPVMKKKLKVLKKKDRALFDKIGKKIMQVVENPDLYKVLSHVSGTYRRVHVGSFVLVFEIKGDTVYFLSFEHHDTAYKKFS